MEDQALGVVEDTVLREADGAVDSERAVCRIGARESADLKRPGRGTNGMSLNNRVVYDTNPTLAVEEGRQVSQAVCQAGQAGATRL